MNYSIMINKNLVLLTRDLVNGTNLKKLIYNKEVFNIKIVDYINYKCNAVHPYIYYSVNQTLFYIRVSLIIFNYLYQNKREYSDSLDGYLSIKRPGTTISYDCDLLQRYYILSLLVDLLDIDKRILYEDEFWMKKINKLNVMMPQFCTTLLSEYPLLVSYVKTSVEQMITFNYPTSTQHR